MLSEMFMSFTPITPKSKVVTSGGRVSTPVPPVVAPADGDGRSYVEFHTEYSTTAGERVGTSAMRATMFPSDPAVKAAVGIQLDDLVQELADCPSVYSYWLTVESNTRRGLREAKHALEYASSGAYSLAESASGDSKKATVASINAIVARDPNVIAAQRVVDRVEDELRVITNTLRAIEMKHGSLKELSRRHIAEVSRGI